MAGSFEILVSAPVRERREFGAVVRGIARFVAKRGVVSENRIPSGLADREGLDFWRGCGRALLEVAHGGQTWRAPEAWHHAVGPLGISEEIRSVAQLVDTDDSNLQTLLPEEARFLALVLWSRCLGDAWTAPGAADGFVIDVLGLSDVAIAKKGIYVKLVSGERGTLLYEKRSKLPEGTPRAYLRETILNALRDRQKQERHRLLGDQRYGQICQIETIAAANERDHAKDQIAELLTELSDADSMTLLAFRECDGDRAAVAERLGISRAAVDQRLSRIRRKLRAKPAA